MTLRALLAFMMASTCLVAVAQPADAQIQYQRITGEGSSFAANAIDAWRVAVRQSGLTVDYNPSGSSAGRRSFLDGSVQFAVSDVPFQFAPEDGSAPEAPLPGTYGYVPATAGGTAFAYNLRIADQRVTNLRLAGENVVKIFTGVITRWNDPALLADNPGLRLPDRAIVPVVRSDGAGTTSQLTSWMVARHGDLWNDYCILSGRAPACGPTSSYPTIPGMVAQAGDLGVAGYVSQAFAEGSIGYTNYSSALGAQLPVAKVLNAAGLYTEPTPDNVSVSLSQATINNDPSNPATYLTSDLSGVYTSTDPRNYELSSYSFFIVRTGPSQYDEVVGRSVAAFTTYAICQGQQLAPSLGHASLPINLVTAAFDQIGRIPGADTAALDVAACDNPTFSPDGTNLVVQNAPLPPPCDALGAAQCRTGTGGLADVPTVILPSPDGGGIDLEPSSGTFATPFALRFDPPDQACPGADTEGWASSTFLTADAPARLVHAPDGQPSSPSGGRTTALRNDTGAFVSAVPPAAGDFGIGEPANLSFAQTFATTPLAPGVYNVGISCWNAAALGSLAAGETAKFWTTQITVTESGGDFSYVQGVAPAAPVLSSGVLSGTTQTIDIDNPDPTLQSYDLAVSPPPADPLPGIAPGATSFQLTGLTIGQSYEVMLTAVNVVGSTASLPLTFVAGVTGPAPVVLAFDVFENTAATISWTVPTVPGVPEPVSYDVTISGPTPVTPVVGVTGLSVTVPAAELGLGAYSVTVTPQYAPGSGVAGTPGSGTFTVNPDARVVEEVTVVRPAGALILTQRCGVSNALPAFGSVDQFPGFPDALPAVPGTEDQVGTAPAIDLDMSSMRPDPEFANYPLPNPPSGPATYPTACGVDMGVAQLVTQGALAGQFFRASGRLNEVTVLDTRDVDGGWVLRGDVEDRFTSLSNGDSFSGDYLGWQPVLTDDSDEVGGEGPNGVGPLYDQAATAAPGVLPGSGFGGPVPGMTDNPVLASTAAGAGLGIATLDARLVLLIPMSVDAADYSATLTLTLA